jgi:hypothetical protein
MKIYKTEIIATNTQQSEKKHRWPDPEFRASQGRTAEALVMDGTRLGGQFQP